MSDSHLWTAPNPLERNTANLSDASLVAARWNRPDTTVFLLSPRSALGDQDRIVCAASVCGEYDPQICFFLGETATGSVFAKLLDSGVREIRTILDDVPETDIPKLFAAAALVNWHSKATYCPVCAGLTRSTTGGWVRVCGECGLEIFPRTDPAVIVALTNGDRLLLGHNYLWAPRRVSVFAGFVEAGESLEQAVIREVAEEVKLSLTNIRYFGSQSWPFPASLMVGFNATAVNVDFEVDGDEIEYAKWFTKAELLDATACGEVLLPNKYSIAHRLISAWLEGSALAG
ncbi:MAG: NAD(+) diphosphatase [Propionibacteriaceae bacterium]|nr:NAD(+) diphosphatase [Propionibacteriaceae bacterium]